MTDPVARAIVHAPAENEPLTEKELKALDEAREWSEYNEVISHEKVLRDLGIMEDEIDASTKPDDADRVDRTSEVRGWTLRQATSMGLFAGLQRLAETGEGDVKRLQGRDEVRLVF